MGQFDGNVAKLVVELEARIGTLEADLKKAQASIRQTATEAEQGADKTEGAFTRMSGSVLRNVGAMVGQFAGLGAAIGIASAAARSLLDTLTEVESVTRALADATENNNRQQGLFAQIAANRRSSRRDRLENQLEQREETLVRRREARDSLTSFRSTASGILDTPAGLIINAERSVRNFFTGDNETSQEAAERSFQTPVGKLLIGLIAGEQAKRGAQIVSEGREAEVEREFFSTLRDRNALGQEVYNVGNQAGSQSTLPTVPNSGGRP